MTTWRRSRRDHSADRTVQLPDGSLCVIEPTGPRTTLVSRHVDGRCVWGQAFSTGDDHAAQVDDVVAEMTDRPGGFRRWWLDEADGG